MNFHPRICQCTLFFIESWQCQDFESFWNVNPSLRCTDWLWDVMSSQYLCEYHWWLTHRVTEGHYCILKLYELNDPLQAPTYKALAALSRTNYLSQIQIKVKAIIQIQNQIRKKYKSHRAPTWGGGCPRKGRPGLKRGPHHHSSLLPSSSAQAHNSGRPMYQIKQNQTKLNQLSPKQINSQNLIDA